MQKHYVNNYYFKSNPMKHFIITLVVLIALAYCQHAVAQDPYCGLIYSYDNAGNRIQRKIVPCGPGFGGGGGGESSKRDITDSDTAQNKNTDAVLLQSMFPNPTTGAVSIVFNQPVDNAEITVSDNIGRKLFTTQASGSTLPLNLSGYPSGTYFITTKARGQTFQSSVVKN